MARLSRDSTAGRRRPRSRSTAGRRRPPDRRCPLARRRPPDRLLPPARRRPPDRLRSLARRRAAAALATRPAPCRGVQLWHATRGHPPADDLPLHLRLRPLLRLGQSRAGGDDDARPAPGGHRPDRGGRLRHGLLRRRRASTGLSGRAGRRPPRSCRGARRRRGDQLLLGGVGRRRPGLARAARRDRPRRLRAVVVCLLHGVARRRDPPAQRRDRRPAARPAHVAPRSRRAGRGGRPRRRLRSARRDHVQGAGGSRRSPAASACCRPPDTLTSCPYEDFSDPGRAHVGCDGNLQLCQGISAGNVFERPLAELSVAYDPDSLPVVREILAGGPWELARRSGLAPRRALYADECHLCYEVRGRLRAAGRHLDVLAPDACYGVGVGGGDDGLGGAGDGPGGETPGRRV